MSSIKEIVLKTGLSQSTVMRVLKGSTNVKPETMEKIFNAAKEIGYEINRTKSTIGVILTSDGNIYYNSLIDSIKSTAEKISSFNYNVILETMKGYDIERQINLLDQLSEKAEVIIITPINHPDIINKINELTDKGKKIITLNFDVENSKRLCHIGVDYIKVGRLAGNLIGLIVKENTKVAMLYGSDNVLCHKERLDGFKDYVNQHRPDINIVTTVKNSDNDEDGYTTTKKLLKDYPDVNALFISSGGISGICKAIKEANKVGKITVIASGRNPVIEALIKEGVVTATISQNPVEQGKMAVLTAFNMMTTNKKPDFDKHFVDIMLFYLKIVIDNILGLCYNNRSVKRAMVLLETVHSIAVVMNNTEFFLIIYYFI